MNGVVTRVGSLTPDDEPGATLEKVTKGDQDDYYVVHLWASAAFLTFSVSVCGAPSPNSNAIILGTISHTQLDANRSASVLVPAFPHMRFVFNGGTGGQNLVINLME